MKKALKVCECAAHPGPHPRTESCTPPEPMPMDYMGVRPPGELTHLGDGAYAQFDGYQIWLFANSPHSSHKVALEPGAFRGLLEYAKRYWVLPQ